MKTSTASAAPFAITPTGRLPLILSVSLTGFSTATETASRPPTKSKSARIRDAKWFPTDAIRDMIRAAFEADARVPSGRIGIAVAAGVIALFGTVPDERAKRAAFELASAIPGAPPVWNRLRIG